MNTSEETKTRREERTPARAEKKKPQRWIHFRHRVVRVIAYSIIYPYSFFKYGLRLKWHHDKRQYTILYNHQTPFDQFFVGMAFPRVIYYLATEDIFSNGLISTLIRYLVAPIPIRKQTTDLKAIKTILKVAREGGSIAIAPEGNRTYSGRTEYMSPSIAPLVRRLGLPIALYRLEGGYGVEPRWSDTVRRGRIRGYVSEIIEPEEYATLTDDELFHRIESGLFVDEAKCDATFHSRRSAEYLERVLYVCPKCGLSTFHSEGDTVTCEKCGLAVRYLSTKELSAIENELPFRFLADWYDYQKDFMNGLDTPSMTKEPLYRDTATLSEVIVYERKQVLLKDAEIRLYADRIEITSEGGFTIPFSEATAVAVLGRNKLNVYYDKRVLQLRGSKRFNALKYVHFYHRYKNLTTGDPYGKFLGL